MATNLNANPLTNIWAGNSQNKISINQNLRSQGIEYKSIIKSDELNGFGFDIYSNVYYNQFTGGNYSQQLTYNKNQFCNILWKQSNYSTYKVVNCVCINDNNGTGISNIPPVLNANVELVNGVNVYNGGVENSQYWKLNFAEINSNFKTFATIDTTTIQGTKEQFFKLCDKLTSTTTASNTIQEYKINGTIIGYKGNNAVAIEFTAEAKQYNISGTQSIGSNVFGIGDWNINFYNVNFLNQTNTAYQNFNADFGNNQYQYFMPLSMSIVLSNERLFLTSLGLDKIEILGYGNIEFTLSSVTSLPITSYYLPIRQNGGCQVFKDLGIFKWNSYNITNNNTLSQGLLAINQGIFNSNEINFDRGLSLFNTPNLSIQYGSLINNIKTLYPELTDQKFIRMSNEDSQTYQIQEDVFHDIFSGSFFDTIGLYSYSSNAGGVFIQTINSELDSFGTNVGGVPSYLQQYSLNLNGKREHNATETRPKNFALPLTLQIF